MLHTASPVHYSVQLHDVHAHLYQVSLHIAAPAAEQVLSLPAWIPGSYLVREFARQIQSLIATQNGQPVAVQQLRKDTWQLQCSADAPVQVQYCVNAYDTSVRTAWLDQRRGFFNGTSLLLCAQGLEHQPHRLHIAPPTHASDWQLATGLTPVAVDAQGFGTYAAQDYDELIDCPVEMGAFWSGSFTACGVEHRFVVAGAPASFDGERLLADTQKICETEIRFWHPQGQAPHRNYVFMLNVTHDGYGGLEHRNSTALLCTRADLPRQGVAAASDGYISLLGLISHEYFHTWNVKRLKPAPFVPYDLSQESYTELLWFFEGLTSYYDDLLLRRAGLIDNAAYLKLLNKTLNQVQQTPGRYVQSVAQASFDAWVKYYRQDENTLNTTVSYYTKGALVGMCLDLKLRQEGQATLDDVMRGLWAHCQGGAMTQADVLQVLEQLTGRSWEAELQAWVHSTDELPWQSLLHAHGVQAQADTLTRAQRLGLRVQESHSVMVKQVLRGGLAEQAGLMAGDEWLGVEVAGQSWRLTKLDELDMYVPHGTHEVVAWVARDRQLLRLPLSLQAAADPAQAATAGMQLFRLRSEDDARVTHWLQG